MSVAVTIVPVDSVAEGFTWGKWKSSTGHLYGQDVVSLRCPVYWSQDDDNTLVEGIESILSSRGIDVAGMVQLDG